MTDRPTVVNSKDPHTEPVSRDEAVGLLVREVKHGRVSTTAVALALLAGGYMLHEDRIRDLERDNVALRSTLREALYIMADDTRAEWDALSKIHRAVAPNEPPLTLPDIKARIDALRASMGGQGGDVR